MNLSTVGIVAMSGIKGQKKLTVADSPYEHAGLIVAAKTVSAGNTVSGEQFDKPRNDTLDDFVDRPISDNGIADVVNVTSSTWVITAGETIIYFG